MASSAVDRVAIFAFYSRILVFFLQAFFNNAIPDHAPDVFNPPRTERLTNWDSVISILFDGFKRWDAQYFLHIAEHGYSYENCLAFFPLFPLLVQLTADSVFYPLQYVMSYSNVLLTSATALNLWFFIQAAKVFYRLSLCVLEDETLAFKAAQLFCINPASIFFSAAYSESLYCLLTFCGLLQYEKKHCVNASFFFSLSGATRSNGLVNLGFILYGKGIELLKDLNIIPSSECKGKKSTNSFTAIISTVLSVVVYILICITPFLIYQSHAYTLYCDPEASENDLKDHILNYGNERGYQMAHMGPSPWCQYTVPLSYSYVQNNHWGVGFLTYYEFQQVPNFLLAAPMVVLCLVAVCVYCKNVLPHLWKDITVQNRKKVVDEEFRRPEASGNIDINSDNFPETEYYMQSKSDKDEDTTLRSRNTSFVEENEDKEEVNVKEIREEPEVENDKNDNFPGLERFYQERVFVYIVHLFFLTLVATFFMHIQVITRFICSASPIVFWFTACLTTSDEQLKRQPYARTTDGHQRSSHGQLNGKDDTISSLTEDMMDWDNKNIESKLIFCYFHLYFFVGIASFSNFLPWT